ncbi:hypothetical protein Bca52824_002901 [Brassica carinata]|uniref:non-specific serine/threonine protein kinase n=1 Tax=Brassica carinata TaxID=52824 RepID=A0A8X7WL62_BRACI|nr:hypothetical protein Bca52824_002901 [Brassica carinata]
MTLSCLFLFIFNFQDVIAFATTARYLCRPEQRNVLLEFRKEFKIRRSSSKLCNINGRIVGSYPKTESWENNSDCCYWDGVTCDAKSKDVIKLDLSCSCLHGRFHSNTSLVRLQNLKTLDLSNNYLYGQIPFPVGELSRLTSLSLSNNRFSGQILPFIVNISHLTFLHLSNNLFWGHIPFSIGNFSHLTFLDLSSNHFAGHIPYSIGILSQLKSLRLSDNQFSGQIPSSLGNLSDLTSLDLSGNQFSGQIPSSLGKVSHLTSLQLFDNQFSNQIPSSLGNLSHLTSLDFSHNQLSDQIPSSLGKLSHLTSLDCYDNSLAGQIPSSFSRLNQLSNLVVNSNKLTGKFPIALLNLTKLSYLSLSNNRFTGTLPPNITSLSNLEFFFFFETQLILMPWKELAYDNAFVGALPSSLFNLPSLTSIYLTNNQLGGSLKFGNISSPSKLRVLSLGSNQFKGPIPSSISKLVNLEVLDISHWNSNVDFGIFSLLRSLQRLYLSHLRATPTIDLNTVLSCFKSLDLLDLSGNHVLATNKTTVSDVISNLNLSGCGITEFPELLRTQTLLQTLDISNNKIKGHVPGWLWMLPNLGYLDLSNNTFIGFETSTRHKLSSVLGHLFGSNNNFSGEVPSLICELHSLRTLDLSNNNFSGSIPLCIGNLNSTLSVLNVRQNRLSGCLPRNAFESLRSLDVGHNQLVGKLPRSLVHFSALEVLNVESNMINDTFPFWLNSLQELRVLVLRSNAFHGPVHQASFPNLQIIDISHNHFSGILPSDYFVNLRKMSSLEVNKDRSNLKYTGEAAIGFVPGIVFGLAIGYILVCYKTEWFSGRNKHRSRSTPTR